MLVHIDVCMKGDQPMSNVTLHRADGPEVSCHDVAAYILEKCGKMSAMKLQKLVYYCQAWSLVWDDRPMFPERIEAWVNGPVVRELYDYHRGKFEITEWPLGNPANLDDTARETIDAVLNFYAQRNAQWLSDLTHSEDPWRIARKNTADGVRGACEITLDVMAEYYSSIRPGNAEGAIREIVATNDQSH
jgi:uncharacterized phage-associated protein